MKNLISALLVVFVLPAFAGGDASVVNDVDSAGVARASRVIPAGIVAGNNNSESGTRASSSRGATAAQTKAEANKRGGTDVATRTIATNTKTTWTVTERQPVQSASVVRVGATANNVVANSQQPSAPIYTGRVATRTPSVVSRGANVSVFSTNSKKVTSETVADVKATLGSLMELTESCQKQYNDCMDNFCNVLDEEYSRCSCSKNIKNYEKTEEALKAATAQLQEVAQQIQYLGLTVKEIETLFTETESESVIRSTSDSSKLKNDLSRIKTMLVDVKSGTASMSTDTGGVSLDMSNILDFNIDSTGFDISSLFNTSSNTSSISNQRGEALYNSAASRCKSAVLNNCAAKGVNMSAVAGAYDVEIDKQCLLYERKLNDENAQIVSTIRNAQVVLQKARLMVAKQKNEYDLRACTNALGACMEEDYVCGSGYIDCLDPSGEFIVNGEVVVGSMPGASGGSWGANGNAATADKGVYTTWNDNGQNVWAPGSGYTLTQYVNSNLSKTNAAKNHSNYIVEYLQQKIGYYDKAKDKNYGYCMSALNKCQKYTYDKDGNYMPKNQVVLNYMTNAMREIKKAQDDVLSGYASTCFSEVSSCLSKNNYSYSVGSIQTGTGNPNDVAIRACLPIINTCRSVTMNLSKAEIEVGTLSNVYDWLDSAMGTTYEEEAAAACTAPSSGGTWNSRTKQCDCSMWAKRVTSADGKTCVASNNPSCGPNYFVNGQQCTACPNHSHKSGTNGTTFCVCDDDYYVGDGQLGTTTTAESCGMIWFIYVQEAESRHCYQHIKDWLTSSAGACSYDENCADAWLSANTNMSLRTDCFSSANYCIGIFVGASGSTYNSSRSQVNSLINYLDNNDECYFPYKHVLYSPD